MKQLIFKFPFQTSYFNSDFYVSKNNFDAYKLLENYNKLPSKLINISGPKGSGKTHLVKILKNKLEGVIFNASEISQNKLETLNFKVIIIDNYYKLTDIDPLTFYSLINQSISQEQTLIVNSILPLIYMDNSLKDLTSRFKLFLNLNIDLPTDDLMQVIIQKNFSDRQIIVDAKTIDYIIKRIDRSYDKLFKFVEEIDNISLTSGKSVNLNLIKKVFKLNE